MDPLPRRSQAAGRRSRVTSPWSQVAGRRPQAAGRRPQAAGRRPQATCRRSLVPGPWSLVAGYRLQAADRRSRSQVAGLGSPLAGRRDQVVVAGSGHRRAAYHWSRMAAVADRSWIGHSTATARERARSRYPSSVSGRSPVVRSLALAGRVWGGCGLGIRATRDGTWWRGVDAAAEGMVPRYPAVCGPAPSLSCRRLPHPALSPSGAGGPVPDRGLCS